MPITIIRLLGFQGPNVIMPQAGVLLEAYATADYSARLRNGIKDVGQQIGMVVGALAIGVHQLSQSFVVTAHFATPTPDVAKAAVQYIIDGLNAREAGDDTWDAEEGLEILHERHLAESLPFAALQIIAEATRRGIPTFRRDDGALQIGYGVRGYRLDPKAIPFDQRRDAAELIQSLPWQSLGTIPILAISGIGASVINGERTGERTMQSGAQAAWPTDLQYEIGQSFSDRRVGMVVTAHYAQARDLLGQPDLDIAILDLAPSDLLETGLPFDQCIVSVIGGFMQPTAARNAEEATRAIALPLLVTNGHVLLVAPTPLISELARYATCPVSVLSFEQLVPALVSYAKRLIEATAG